jgi:hypothetical protein
MPVTPFSTLPSRPSTSVSWPFTSLTLDIRKSGLEAAKGALKLAHPSNRSPLHPEHTQNQSDEHTRHPFE